MSDPFGAVSHEVFEFPETSEAEWRHLAEKALAGEPFATLVSRTEDGVEYGPIHRRRMPAAPILKGDPETPWKIVQRIDDPDPTRANAQALADLEGGANALSLVFEGAPSSHGFGLPMTGEAIETALSGVMLDIVHLRIEPHGDPRIAVEALRHIASSQGLDIAALDLDLCLDPVGPFAATGHGGLDRDAGGIMRDLVDGGFAGCIAEADGRVYHDGGASEAQELGAVLATAVHHLRAMEGAGFEIDRAASAVGVSLAADQRQFLVTAKVRAIRLLWARLRDGLGLDPAPLRIHVETSWRMMAARDPHTNILRSTVAAFAAATGGADSISVLPFTIANGLPEAKARRLARNLQVILQDEAGLGRVCDPAAGSGGIETLTDGIAKAAWDEFRRIEGEGGIVTSLASGALQARIAGTRTLRQAALSERREAAIGVTIYPLDVEREMEVLIPRKKPSPSRPGPGIRLSPLRLTEELETAA